MHFLVCVLLSLTYFCTFSSFLDLFHLFPPFYVSSIYPSPACISSFQSMLNFLSTFISIPIPFSLYALSKYFAFSLNHLIILHSPFFLPFLYLIPFFLLLKNTFAASLFSTPLIIFVSFFLIFSFIQSSNSSLTLSSLFLLSPLFLYNFCLFSLFLCFSVLLSTSLFHDLSLSFTFFLFLLSRISH